MTDPRPAPLVPAEVDLRDFPGMWFDVSRLIKSETWVMGSGDECKAALTLWMQSWHQVPAGSLPNEQRMLEHLSMSKRWRSVREHALRGWILCSDGRLYHPVVCEKALEAWVEKLTNSISGALGNSKRWNIDIDVEDLRRQLVHSVDLLRSVAPQSRVLKKKAVVVNVAASLQESRPESPPDMRPESPPDIQPESPPDLAQGSPPDIRKASPPDRKGPDRTGPDRTELLLPPHGGGGAAPGASPPPSSPPVFDGKNADELNGKAVAVLAEDFELPEQWGVDAEALGFKPQEVLREGEKFRQYWTRGKGKGTRRSVKGWSQSWSNWLDKAARDLR